MPGSFVVIRAFQASVAFVVQRATIPFHSVPGARPGYSKSGPANAPVISRQLTRRFQFEAPGYRYHLWRLLRSPA